MISGFDKFGSSYVDELDLLLGEFGSGESQYYSKVKVNYLLEKFKINNKYNILEFGCGTGNNLIELEKTFVECEIYGADISMKSLEVASKRVTNAKLFHLEENSLDTFANNFFDIILAINVFHHIDPGEHLGILKVLYDKVKKGGYFVLIEHNTKNPLTIKLVEKCVFDKDAKLLSANYAKKIILDSGFEDVETDYLTFFIQRLSFLLPMEKYLRQIPFGAQYATLARK